MTNLAFPSNEEDSEALPDDVLFLDRRRDERAQAFLGIHFSSFSPENLLRRVEEIGNDQHDLDETIGDPQRSRR